MPIPMGGLVPVAEFGSVFEADLVAQRLRDAGIPATTSYDPALASVATYLASDRTADVVVSPDDLERAQAFLDSTAIDPDGDDGLPDAFHTPEVEAWSRSRQPTLADSAHPRGSRRLVMLVVLLAFSLPVLAGIVIVVTQ